MAGNGEVRRRILEAAGEQFFACGFNKVTMDEIASLLSMSKKTVYEHFSSKDRMLDAVLERQIISAMRQYAEIMNSPTEYVDKLYNVFCLVGRSFSHMSKRFQDELRRLRPDLWHYMADIRRLTLFASFMRFIDDGINQGFVRADIPRDVFLFTYISTLQSVMSSDVLIRESFSANDAFTSITQLILDGMLTERARQQFRHSESYHQLTQRIIL